MRLLTGHEALSHFRVDPTEPGHPLRPDHDELVTALVHGPLRNDTNASGRLRGVRRRVYDRLNGQLLASSSDADEALTAVLNHALTSEAERKLRRAFRSGTNDEALLNLIIALHRTSSLVKSSQSGTDQIRIVSTLGVAP